jgi:hypothetical protein
MIGEVLTRHLTCEAFDNGDDEASDTDVHSDASSQRSESLKWSLVTGLSPTPRVP